jgi:hypothetical protein
MTTVICSEPVTIDLELSGATLQVQTDSLAAVPESWPTSPTPSPPATR